MSSGQDQSGSVSTPVNIPSLGYLGFAPPWQPQSYPAYADVTKDGRKMLAIVARKNDAITKLLKPHVGSLVTIYVPQLGVAWTPTLAERRRWGYIYVRIPSRLKKLFEPIWLAGYPIPVIITIPPIPATPLKDGLKSQGETPRAPGSKNRGAPGDQAVRSPSNLIEVDEV